MKPAAALIRTTALAVVLLMTLACAPALASFGVTEPDFEAGTCTISSCTYASSNSDFYTQAAGHPEYGITSFEVNSKSTLLGREPEGALKRIRVDIPPGLAADPQAIKPCSRTTFEAGGCTSENQAGTTAMEASALGLVLALEGKVYNLQRPPGLPLDFGIEVAPLQPLVKPVRLYLEGHVDWSGDYHEYFEINNVPDEAEILGGGKAPLGVLKSKLIFEGRKDGNFLTLPSVCASTTTSYLEVESYAGEISRTATHTPVGVEGCDKVPFKPTATITPETASSDQPDGLTADVHALQKVEPQEINTADIQDATVKLPEGMTLNPAAAQGLETCSESQIAIGSTAPVTCPAGSKLGLVSIETDLPPHSLTGNVYLGNPNGGSITGPPFTIYLDAESVYDVSVRLKGSVEASPETGRLEATFTENPRLPFEDLKLTLNGGPRAPLANPLVCGTSQVESVFTPYTGGPQALSSEPFLTTGCLEPLPFSLSQSTQSSNATAGAYTNYTLNLTRADGQQYLSKLSTALPAGLLGAIPSVALCGEPQASQGSCSSASQIGTATVTAGSGSEPPSFSGTVYLTGPYDGAPYGLSIPVAGAVGPFDFGTVVTRATISVDPNTARVIVTSAIPTIVKGVPLRLKSIGVDINREKFLFNPTNCGALAQETTLTSTFGATQGLSSPFQVGECTKLPFKPSFSASTRTEASKLSGVPLTVKITQGAGQANIHEVHVELPKLIVARITTLQQSCTEATYNANPNSCPAASKVGQASVTTPVLPGELTGPAYLVSHGNTAFPDLELILAGDGVSVTLDGKTSIKGPITSSTFSAVPDVPISTFELSLPAGPDSALAAPSGLCKEPLSMPTTIVAQSGAKITQNTPIAVSGCSKSAKIKVLSHRIHANKLVLRLRTTAAGRTTVKGNDLKSVSRSYDAAKTFTVEVPLSRAGRQAIRRHKHMKVKVKVAFTPEQQGESRSSASLSVKFRR